MIVQSEPLSLGTHFHALSHAWLTFATGFATPEQCNQLNPRFPLIPISFTQFPWRCEYLLRACGSPIARWQTLLAFRGLVQPDMPLRSAIRAGGYKFCGVNVCSKDVFFSVYFSLLFFFFWHEAKKYFPIGIRAPESRGSLRNSPIRRSSFMRPLNVANCFRLNRPPHAPVKLLRGLSSIFDLIFWNCAPDSKSMKEIHWMLDGEGKRRKISKLRIQ